MGTKDRSRPALSSSSSSPCSPSGSVLPHSDRLSPKELKMASPNRSSVVSAPAAPASQSVLVQSRKSSLAFILTGNQECDGDGQEDDEEDEQEDAKGHEYGSYQQEYVARHSFYESHGHSSQFSRRQEHTQQHHHSRPQQHAQYFHQHQQQYRHQECQPQRSQLRYPPPTSAPAASFSSTPHMRPSFPLEVRPEPPRSPFESGRWAETQPRKKGSKFCVVPGCISRAKHARLCWKHGGSVKCKVSTCSNRAKSKGVCWSHGGGTICSFDDCSTISVSNGVCWAHGGGKRCVVEGCGRPSYERTGNLCSVHFADSIV
ncbi:hypothetical protein Gpo141_00011157 [Globisporangium polare]